MRVLLRQKALILLIVVGCGLTSSRLQAGDGDKGHGFVEFGLGYYNNEDNGGGKEGNPFLDEELTVIEPVVVFDYYVSDETAVLGKFSYDYVSSASIERLSNFPNHSGASGDNYFGFDLGIRREFSETKSWSVVSSIGVEFDYVSLGLGAAYQEELPEQNASYKISINGFYDEIDVVRFNAVDEDTEARVTLTGQFSWYQILNRLTHAEIGSVFSVQTGFLETPYNAVVVEDTVVPNPQLVGQAPGREITEELESHRLRAAFFGSVRRSVTERHSIELGGRLYGDDWGIYSLALEPRWYTWLVEDILRLRLRYRVYRQTEADDYSDRFFLETGHRTQDSDLASFTSHSLGSLVSWTIGTNSEWDLGGDYVYRDDGITQIIARTSYRRNF